MCGTFLVHFETAIKLVKSNFFRGHVREPDVEDLHYIARDMQLAQVEIFGRNWAGYLGGRAVRTLTRLLDPLLQRRPSLCSDLYLVGRKPA